MILLKGYNREKKKDVTLEISDSGAVIDQDWENIEFGSVKLYTGQLDCERNMLWQDDEIVSELSGLHMYIRFGEYEAYCPEDKCMMKNVGFYVEAPEHDNMPLGPTEEYARKVIKEETE